MILAILVVSHLGNIPMKFESQWPKGSGGVSFLSHLVYRSGTVLAILLGSHRGNIPMKFESHWPKGSGGVSF